LCLHTENRKLADRAKHALIAVVSEKQLKSALLMK